MARVTGTDSSSRRSWETKQERASETAERGLELLNGGKVEMVGRLIEHQEVHPEHGKRRQLGPGAFSGRQRGRRPLHRVGPEAELGELAAGLVGGQPGRPCEGVGKGGAVPQDAPILGQFARRRRPGPCGACPTRRGSRPSIASTSVVLPEPLAPTRATRSAQAMSSVNGPRVKSPRATTASSRRTTTSPERSASLMENRRSQPSQGFSTGSRESSARWVRRARPARFSVRSIRKSRWVLSLSRGRRFSCATPVVAHCRSRWARLAQLGALGLVRRRTPPLHVHVPLRARIRSRPSRRRRGAHRACARPARGRPSRCVRGTPDRARRSPCAPRRRVTISSSRARPSKSRSFVGSSSSVMSKRERRTGREGGAGLLTSRERGQRLLHEIGGESHLRERAAQPRLEVAGRRRLEASQCCCVAVVGAGGPSPRGRCGLGQSGFGCGDPRSAFQRGVARSRRSSRRALGPEYPTVACGGSMRTSPAPGSIRPARICSSVDLPTPLGPTTPRQVWPARRSARRRRARRGHRARGGGGGRRGWPRVRR